MEVEFIRIDGTQVLLVLISTIFGGGGAAYITNNHFGRQYTIREDRKAVLDNWLPQIWDQSLSIDPRRDAINDPVGARPIIPADRSGAVFDHVWRHLNRTTWRDRQNFRKFYRASKFLRKATPELEPESLSAEERRLLSGYRIAHRQFEYYLLRQFDRRWMRIWRWLEAKDLLDEWQSLEEDAETAYLAKMEEHDGSTG